MGALVPKQGFQTLSTAPKPVRLVNNPAGQGTALKTP
jgi:hypothetical protein